MGDLVVRIDAEGVATLRLESPPVNAIVPELLRDLGDALADVDRDALVGAVVLHGGGKGFCGGGDTRNMGEMPPVDKHRTMRLSGGVIEQIVGLSRPVVGAVHGYAVGGGLSLALACDVLVVDRSARLRLGFVDLAIVPDMGAHHLLAAAVGVRRAKELIWDGAAFTGADAVAWGMANEAVDDGLALERATERATTLAAGPRHAIGYTKSILARAQLTELGPLVELEGYASSMLRATADHREAVTAAREKRAPVFGRDG